VALKIIRAQFVGNEAARSRFLREARAAASVRHSNVASVFHLGESGGNYFYAMEFVDGETLEKLIRRRGPLEIELTLEIVTQVAAGLSAIHKQHLVHRDIKPGNIMLSWEEGRLENVKIIDLGLAKWVTEDSLSIAGGFVGTPVYASPEQFAGFGTDIRSDLYSLGVTLWEMVSGKPPFQGSVAELMDQHQHTAPPLEKLKDIPEPIVALLDVLLAKNPSQRFQSPAQLQQALKRVTEAVSSELRLTADELRLAGEPVAPRSPKAKPKKQPVRWLLGAGLCLVIVVITWFFASGHLGLFNQRATEAASTEKSIAVLPFENISPNKDDAYFADGMQDEILANVARICQLKVISRTSVMQYRPDGTRDLRQIASALGVANILEGTVRRAGNRVRITIELVDAKNDRTIWSESYDRDLSDIFAIQSEVAQTIASKLAASLSQSEKEGIEAKPTDNLAAYDLYLKGKELFEYIDPISNRFKERPMLDAIGLFEQALGLDPKFALAYCASAKAHDSLYAGYYDRTRRRRALGDAAIKNALRLQPDLAEAHLADAFHLYVTYGDYEHASAQLAIAMRTLQNSSEAYLLGAYMNRRQGQYEKSVNEFDEAILRDPRNLEATTELAFTLYYMRRFAASEQVFDRAIGLAPDVPILKVSKAFWPIFMKTGNDEAFRAALSEVPGSMSEDPGLLTWRPTSALFDRDWQGAKALVEKMKGGEDDGGYFFFFALVPVTCYSILLARFQGEDASTNPDFSESRAQLNQIVERSPTNAKQLGNLAIIDALLGRKQDAITKAKRAVEMLPTSKDMVFAPNLIVNLAQVYAWTGELDLAFQQVEIAAKLPNSLYYGDLKLDPLWDPLRKDPRFEKLLAELAPRD
jgi:serine/threonine protein kinase/tetratricopeptide (TPR) repeat protein